MDNIIKLQIEKKAISVIESCTTVTQLNAAEKYISLCYKTTGDLFIYRYLIDMYNQKLDQLQPR